MNLKEKLSRNETVFGTWIQTGNCVVAEILCEYGFDFIAMDMEHTEINEQEFANAARSIKGRSIPLARVRENDTIAIRRVLDSGAEGVIVPLVSTKEDALKAVAAAKYPPFGIRGFAFVRANGWGKEFDEYAITANKTILVIVMIESKQGVENIDDILSVDGVDGVLIGPYDLSGSYGVAGKTDHILVKNAKNDVLDACKRHGKAAGQHIVLPTKENVAEAIKEGYTFLALGMDTVFLAEGAKKTMEMTK
jgi:2,4-dihydroxyhept-2-ene-1,7-dioic acid aldolase